MSRIDRASPGVRSINCLPSSVKIIWWTEGVETLKYLCKPASAGASVNLRVIEDEREVLSLLVCIRRLHIVTPSGEPRLCRDRQRSSFQNQDTTGLDDKLAAVDDELRFISRVSAP